MATTSKRITLALTKEDIRQLKELELFTHENVSQILKRALTLFHYITLTEANKTK